MTIRGRIAMTLLSIGAPLWTAAAAKPRDACRASAEAAFRSCKTGAQSDKLLAAGKCANAADAAAVRKCNQAAGAAAKETVGECRDQHAARQAACKRFGSAPYSPAIDPTKFSTTIDNPYFPLSPGTRFVYEGPTAQGLEHDEVFVTHNTRMILGVTCVEVHDTVLLNGRLAEDTLDWFAQDSAGNVWYFGENSREVDGDLVVSLEGSWQAGVDGAQPGIVMEAHPAVGDFYRQEFLLGEAEDLAEVESLTDAATVPAGSFSGCLRTRETVPLEPDAAENKTYALGVGNVLTVDLETGERSELIEIRTE